MAPALEHLLYAARPGVQSDDAFRHVSIRGHRRQRASDAACLGRRQPGGGPIRDRHRPERRGEDRPDMTNSESSRPEAAFVMMLMQATFWVAAALSALPFTLGGEVFMPLLSIATFGLAAAATGLAIGLIHRRPGARRWSLALESLCL